jgi:folylpolyglutamate synthase
LWPCNSPLTTLQQRDLEKLNIVHVSGTKGKGSTCAYVDSILSRYQRSHSIQNIGLFTSPHLIAVRERIRINSVPIPKASFAKYFFEIWDALAASSQNFEKPVYFRYLTLLSYHVFLQENVNAAIYEVGVGGEYDATNIVDRPAVTGISSLGLDHTFQLGDTIDRIAWHKAGIQKVSCPSFTVPQAPAAMEVIEKLAKERKVESLQIVDLDDRLEGVQIKPDAPFQRLNASLAIALAETTLKNLDPKFQISKNSLPKEFINGLENVVWRGRCEKMVEGNVIWYIDGAHTTESIQYASKWFKDESSKRFQSPENLSSISHGTLTNNREATRVLIFNQQGEREAVKLLESLHTAITASDLKFDHVIFCPTSSPSNLQSRRGKLCSNSASLQGHFWDNV